MPDQRPEAARPPRISFGPPGGWRALGLAVGASSLAAIAAWWLARRWIAEPLVDALGSSVTLATLVVVYRCASLPKRPSTRVALLGWALIVGLAFVVRLLLAAWYARAG